MVFHGKLLSGNTRFMKLLRKTYDLIFNLTEELLIIQ